MLDIIEESWSDCGLKSCSGIRTCGGDGQCGACCI